MVGRRRGVRRTGAVELAVVKEFSGKSNRARGQPDGQAQECDDHVLHAVYLVRVLPVMVVGYRTVRFGVHKPAVDDAAFHEYGDDAVDDVHERHVPADQVDNVKRPRALVDDVQQHLVVGDV